MRYWLFKSEPSCFSIKDLANCTGHRNHWDGVRNYQARNMLRDDIKIGDHVFFYHSSCLVPGIVGTMEVVKAGYPDFTAWDPESEHFDPKSTPENPRWYMVDVRLIGQFERPFSLQAIKQNPKLQDMVIVRPGNRLSITPVTKEEWREVTRWCREY